MRNILPALLRRPLVESLTVGPVPEKEGERK
jgi:hypothetical protein